MSVRRLASFRPHREADDRISRPLTLLIKASLRVLDLLAVCVFVLLAAAPFAWQKRHSDAAIDAWGDQRVADITKVETDWMTLQEPPPFSRGDEPEIRAFLESQPLVLAFQDRQGARPLWVRKDGILVPATGSDRDGLIRRWFAAAEKAGVFMWFPPDAMTDEVRGAPKILLRGDRWQVVKRWKEGSPRVEQSLRNLLGANASFRIALIRPGDDKRKGFRLQAWGAEPNLQADPYSIGQAAFFTQIVSNEFMDWEFSVLPIQAEGRAIRRVWRIQFWLAAAVSASIGLALVLGLVLRARARRRATLDADRMAAMTHSLKTPLAILKARCDTLRLGRTDPDSLDAQLIQIGEEADRMSSMIENALTAIQGAPAGGPRELVTAAWLQGIAEDLVPAFEAEGRSLVLACPGLPGRAALPTLRSALFTLLENALYHGRGLVTLETQRHHRRLLIRVRDQGPGLGAQDMKALGRPFMRIREPEREGFSHEGHGLGLRLLVRTAEREGWGLSFQSEQGKGLCATLEIEAG